MNAYMPMNVPTTQDAMELVIKYLYTGKIESKEFTLKEILDLLKLLELMGEGDLFSEVESFILNKIRNKEFSHEKLLLNASTSEKFKFENITKVVLNLIRDDIKETAQLPVVKYLTSSLMEKLIVQQEEECGDFDSDDLASNDNDEEDDDEVDTKGRKRRRMMTVNEEGNFGRANRERIDSTNYIHKFKTFVNWLSENNNCSLEFKEKMVNLFKLEHFTSSELSTCVRESSLYSDAELMDVLRKKIEDMVNDHAALEKEKEAFQSKLTKVKNDHDALVKSLKSKVKKLEDEKRKIEISAKNTKKF